MNIVRCNPIGSLFAGAHRVRPGWRPRRRGIAEVIVLVGENAQHCHVDGHVADATWSKSGALRSSAPIASSTATRVSTDPEIAPSLMPARSRCEGILVVHGRIGGIDEALDDLDEAIGIVMEWEVPEPSKTSSSDPGIAACASMAWLIGITESRLPKSVARERLRQITSVEHGDHWPRQSTTARSVRANAEEAVGSGRSARMRNTSGRSRPDRSTERGACDAAHHLQCG